MRFCDDCGDMCYEGREEGKEGLKGYCKRCGKEKEGSIGIERVQRWEKKKGKKGIKMNEYLKYDVTLPRMKNMQCINENCKCNLDKSIPSDIIYIRNDDDAMEYVYMCAMCDRVW